MTFGRSVTPKGRIAPLLVCLLVVCSALPLASPAAVAGDNGSIYIESAHLTTYADSDCTRIQLYLRNNGTSPVPVAGIRLGTRYLDLATLAASAPGSTPILEALFAPGTDGKLPSREARRSGGPDGRFVQWFRCLPNPVEPGRVSEVTVSLRGFVTEADIHLVTRGGAELQWRGRKASTSLRLSHVAFDPAGDKIYVYVENQSDHAVRIDHLLLNTVRIDTYDSIPAGRVVAPGGKTCLLVNPKAWPSWGTYVGVGVVGGSEKAHAVVRVINLFPVGAYGVDTRAHLFFDRTDLCLSAKESAGTGPTEEQEGGSHGEFSTQGYYLCPDPYRGKGTWEDVALRLVREMDLRRLRRPFTPCLTNVFSQRTAAMFGGVTDGLLVHPYQIVRSGPLMNAEQFAEAKRWADPRPCIAVPEAFTRLQPHPLRDVSPDEFAYAMWSQIGEGAKGVRYYSRRTAMGYEDIPGLQRRIATENLDLQLLKPFLRIGETYEVATCASDEAIVKSILCGDEGLVLVILRKPLPERKGCQTAWPTPIETTVRVAVPQGVSVEGAFAVEQGLQDTPFVRQVGNAVTLPVRLHTFRILLLPFKPHSLSSATTAPARPLSEGLGTDDLVKDFETRRLEHIGPFLDPTIASSPTRALRTGIELHVLRAQALCRLSNLERKDGAPAEEQAVALVRAYLRLDAADRAERMAAGAQGMDGAERALSVARLLEEIGQYHRARNVLTHALEGSTEAAARFALATRLVALDGEQLKDDMSAVQWARIRLKACPASCAVERRRVQFELAALLCKAGKPRESLAELKKIQAGGATLLPIDCLMGMCLMQIGKGKEAMAHLRKAVLEDERNAGRAHFMIGRMLLADERYPEAREAFRKAIDVGGEETWVSAANRLLVRLSSRKAVPPPNAAGGLR